MPPEHVKLDETLSFLELLRRLKAAPTYESSAPGAIRRSLYGFALSLLAYALTFLVPRLFSPGLSQAIAMGSLLFIEVVALCVTFWYSRGEFYSLRAPMIDFARQLDHDLPHHFRILDWLQAQPMDRLERHADMARLRRERISQKLPLLAGNLPSLGVIPVVVAVYFQSRQIVEGRHPDWFDAFIGLVLIAIYLTSWLSMITKTSLEAMDMYLQEALTSKQKEIETKEH